ncbi:multiubiquitin domain-containing protein [Enterovirga sp. CN4-39]|uniref:multiubiquitin domain-containing protein n=1 Tax=Enterovirga sp. CN4-39 TaxID=3400910 RepID=UPI003C035A8E
MNERKRYTAQVDGRQLTFDDAEVDGREIRHAADRDPASAYVLVEILHRSTRSVGLEEKIDLSKSERSFRTFESDRTFNFTVNERGFEWGIGEIGEADVRLIAEIPADQDVVVEGDPDIVVARGGTISLRERGSEQIVGRRRKPPGKISLSILVNGVAAELRAKPDDKLGALLEKALEETENVGQPVEKWELRDEAGELLSLDETVGALGLKDGAILVASLQTGAAG